tara:strand:+ start:164 stop:517 length:354 start_codon:yes stop_codon:yes gene_type:complete
MKKLLLILSILFATSVYAEHEESLVDNTLYMQQLPALCGAPEKINTYIDHFGFEAEHLSLGRTRMMKDGEPVYMMTYMITKDRTESISVLTIPNGTESCILYHTFDLIENLEDLKKN